jgi:hypothetical protein
MAVGAMSATNNLSIRACGHQDAEVLPILGRTMLDGLG